MADRREVEASATTSASPETVWALLADVESWSRWGPWEESKRMEPGVPDPDGVGSVKRLVRRPVTSVERITVFDPPREFGYELISGLPVKDYRARVTLDPDGSGGTVITWRSEFEPRFPGTGMQLRLFMAKVVKDVAAALATGAERQG